MTADRSSSKSQRNEPPFRPSAPTIGQTRDYFLAEDDTGRRFWLFCDVRQAIPPRWFVHGLFA